MRELRYRLTREGCENASTRDGGQRQHSSQMPFCNGTDRAKAARVSHTKWLSTSEVGKADDGGIARWCAPRSVTTSSPNQSRVAQLESGVRGNSPAPFGAGERPQGSTYRYLKVVGGALAAADRQAVGRRTRTPVASTKPHSDGTMSMRSSGTNIATDLLFVPLVGSMKAYGSSDWLPLCPTAFASALRSLWAAAYQ
jgi:hypothetical protein